MNEHVPMRPCRTCRQPAPDGDCPRHPKRGGYRPTRPSVLRGLSGRLWRSVRAAALLRDGEICQYCGDHATTGDHVVPTSRGGTVIDINNVLAACAPCNTSKGHKTLAEWVAKGTAPNPAMVRTLMIDRRNAGLPI